MDPFSLISGGAGGLTGPSSSAASDGTQSAPFSVNFGGSQQQSYLILGGIALFVLLVMKRGR